MMMTKWWIPLVILGVLGWTLTFVNRESTRESMRLTEECLELNEELQCHVDTLQWLVRQQVQELDVWREMATNYGIRLNYTVNLLNAAQLDEYYKHFEPGVGR